MLAIFRAVRRVPRFHHWPTKMASTIAEINSEQSPADRDAAERVKSNLLAVREAIKRAADSCGRGEDLPRLVAVSKMKETPDLLAAYAAGQRHFGENYVQELCQKAADKRLPGDICWHFMGNLQTNKVKMLVKQVPNLWIVESCGSEKLAKALNKAWGNRIKEEEETLARIGAGAGASTDVERCVFLVTLASLP